MNTVQLDRSGGISIKYRDEGSGRPIIFLHGAFGDHRMWKKQFESSLTEDYRLIGVDLRGHGGTDGGDESSYSVDIYVDDLYEFIQEMEFEKKPVLCGLSLGGMIVQKFAEKYPEKVAGIVTASSITSETLTTSGRVQFGFARVASTIARIVGAERAASVWMIVSKRIHGEPDVDDEVEKMGDEFLENQPEELPPVLESTTVNRGTTDYSAINTPVLILYGEDEPSIVEEHADYMMQRLDDAEVSVLSEAGHISPWDNPEEFNSQLRQFISRLE